MLITMTSKSVQIEPVQFENMIRTEQRYAKRGKQEYNVFSTEVEDVTTIAKWVGVHKPFRVLMDPASYEKLKGNRIKWVFDEVDVLVGRNIITE